MKSAKTTFLKGLRVLTMVGLFALVLGFSLVPLAKVNADTPPNVDLAASPVTVNYGSSSNLYWDSSGAVSCNAGGGWSGSKGLSGSQSTGPLQQNTTFTLTCTNSAGLASTVSVTVAVNPIVVNPPTVTLTANPTSIQSGQSSTLNWNSQNATYCSSSWSSAAAGSATSGSQLVYPTYTTTYNITCTSATGQQANASATVYVTTQSVQPTVTLTANPSSITAGQNSTLTWYSQNATSCSAYWTGSTATSGSGLVVPTVTTTYSITCYGDSGTTPATASATVTVNQNQQQPTVTLTANPTSITSGQNSTLTWNSTNASSCSAYWTGSTATSGSGVVVPSGTTTYSIVCYGTNGQQVNASATVSVNQVQNTPTVNLSANPTSVQSGQSSTLNWNSQNATYCSSSWSGSSSVSGYQTVYPTYTTTYNITCTSATGQQANASATVYVNNNQTCQDTGANNYGGTLPCTYTYYNQTCQDTSANNYRGTLPCTYTYYNQTCQDPSAINYRGVLPCSYNNTYNYNYVNQQPTVVLYADQASVPYNGAATVRWLTTNASSCNASGGSIGWAGIKSIGPGSFYTGSLTGSKTYVITCSNNFGSATDSVSVTVRGQTITTTTTNRPAPTSLVLITSSVDRNQPIVPTLDNTRPRPGDEINYTVSYQNIGTGAITGLSLRMDLPYEVDYMFSTPNNPTRSGNTLIFNLGTLKANGQGTVTVRVRVRDNIPAGTNLNFPATLSYIDPSGFPQSVTANVSAQVWSAPVVPAPVDTNANIFLGANVFGAGFLPGNLFGWLLLLILILLLVLLAKYLFGQSNSQPFSKRTTTTLDQPLGKKTTTTTIQ
jgi:Domain of unknown function DUF11